MLQKQLYLIACLMLLGSWAFAGDPTCEVLLYNEPSLVIVTHQIVYLQEGTARFLERPDLRDLPCILLAENSFPLESERLRERAAQITERRDAYSWGEKVSEIHFMGGYSGLCLNVSGCDAFHKLNGPANSVKFILHASQIYTRGWVPLSKRILDANEDERSKIALDAAYEIVSHRPLHSFYAQEGFDVMSWSVPFDSDQMAYELVLRHRGTLKQVFIELVL